MAEMVRPGEIISADFMNGLLRRIEELEDKTVSRQVLRIDSFTPRNGKFTESEGASVGTFTVFGANFAVPVSENVVDFGGTLITDFDSELSTDNMLVFEVPDIPVDQLVNRSVDDFNRTNAKVIITISNRRFGTGRKVYTFVSDFEFS